MATGSGSNDAHRAQFCTQTIDNKGNQMSLSEDQLALLNEIQRRGRTSSVSGIRTGKISVTELMGSGDKNIDNERRRKGGSEPEINGHCDLPLATNAGVAQKYKMENAPVDTISGWKLPPLPPGLLSLTHEPDRYPYPSVLPPCIFEKMMKAASIIQSGGTVPTRAETQKNNNNENKKKKSHDRISDAYSFQSNNNMRSQTSYTSGPPLNLMHLLPPLAPMFPVVSGMQGKMSAAQFTGRLPYPMNAADRDTMNPSGHRRYGVGHGAMQNPLGNIQRNNQNQKTRKPFFMPYMNVEAVQRGLANGDLFKGVLRVNQRNYEESYVDNPAGDNQQDILILGVHDRNRALHGDTVVVRIKDRDHWVVRDALYDAWRNGNLKARVDDDGKPLTIPPVMRTDGYSEEPRTELVDLGSGDSLQEVANGRRYSRVQLLNIAAKVEAVMGQKGDAGVEYFLGKAVVATISRLTIVRSDPTAPSQQARLTASTATVSQVATPSRRAVGTSNGNATQRRHNFRILSDMPDEDWGIPDMCLQKTAEVVYISEAKNCRAAVGMLKMMSDGNHNWVLFSPNDSRMPRMMIPGDQAPVGFFDRPQDFAKFIYVARILDWQATAQFARGNLYKSLGLAGDIDAETEGLLLANDVDTREFSQASLSSLPVSESFEWKIDEKEFKYRKDLREETVFTIDPVTARDVDDALHIKRIDDCDGKGTHGWEIGVHIADVSHFVQQGTDLDHWASGRATSVYLVHKVIPMLPRILNEDLCSLKAGVDRLTFSVVFNFDDCGNVMNEWFGRTIIRSCSKLTYEHAQGFIDHPENEFPANELPKIHNGKSIQEVQKAVLQLHQVAVSLRKKRILNGSLHLDQPKLCFALNEFTGLPIGLKLFERSDAHILVEEFMLLANMAVARKIESAFPEVALLRRHPSPKIKVLRNILEKCEKVGYVLDGSSSKALASSLKKYAGESEMSYVVSQVLSHLLMSSMQLAVYFCTGSLENKSSCAHYALNVPFYTHFTSPIRRYADIMVHRYLSAALGYSPPPGLTTEEVENLAKHCNDKKLASKTVSDTSDEMFFGVFVKETGPLTERAVVLHVMDAAFDVLIVKYGIVKRVYTNKLRLAREPRFIEGSCPSLILYWETNNDIGNAAAEQVITLCSMVQVSLSASSEPTKFQATLKQPVAGEKTITLAQAIAEEGTNSMV